jgi:spermidine synthase
VADPGSTAAASEPPPGYQRPGQASERGRSVDAPLAFAVLLITSAIAAAHELLGTQAAAYLDPGAGPPRSAATAGGLIAIAVGALIESRLRAPSRERLPWLLASASLLTTASAYALWLAFEHAWLFSAVALGLPLLCGGLLGAALSAAARALGRSLLALGAIERAIDPFRLAAVALVLGLAAAAAAIVGLMRSAAAIGLMLAVLAAWCGPLIGFLERRPLVRARAARAIAFLALAAGFAGFFGAESLLASDELALHTNRVVFAARSERASYVVTSGQDVFELFVDGQLALSGVDEQRYHQALVHPALLVAPRRARVALLGLGHGAELAEILRHADVQAVVLVVPDRRLPELARRLVWPSHRSALDDPRVTLVEREAVLFLADASDRFDVVIVDLPDPASTLDGKNYTRHFYRLLSRRLAPDGVAVVQATSPFGSPRTFAGIVGTLEAAGLSTRPYRAPVPTYGDWGFVLASQQPVPEPPAELDRWLEGSTRLESFGLASDMRAPGQASISTLHDQVVVATFAEERAALGL